MRKVINDIYVDGEKVSCKVSKMSIPLSDVLQDVSCEINLTGIKTWELRFKLGCMLFKLAAWVIGMQGKITVGNATLGEIK